MSACFEDRKDDRHVKPYLRIGPGCIEMTGYSKGWLARSKLAIAPAYIYRL